MPQNLTGANVFTDPVPAPLDGDPGAAVTFVPGYQALADRTQYLNNQNAAIYGDGSDGNVLLQVNNATLGSWLLSGVMQRDAYLNDLVMQTLAAIDTNGYRLFVSGTLDISAAPTGSFFFSGNTGATTLAGGAGGAARASNTIGGSGSAGANAPSTAGGANGGAASPSSGGAGGNGGSGTGGSGGTGGARNNPTALRVPTIHILRGESLIVGGAGGGSGAGSGGDLGAGGGSGGGVLAVFAAKVHRSVTTAVGTFSAKGGNGGSSAIATNGGSGGGGGGGTILCVAGSLTGASAANCMDASGGDGGTSNNGGNGGNGGRIYLIIPGMSVSETIGAAGSAHSGGNGGAGGVCLADL